MKVIFWPSTALASLMVTVALPSVVDVESCDSVALPSVVDVESCTDDVGLPPGGDVGSSTGGVGSSLGGDVGSSNGGVGSSSGGGVDYGRAVDLHGNGVAFWLPLPAPSCATSAPTSTVMVPTCFGCDGCGVAGS